MSLRCRKSGLAGFSALRIGLEEKLGKRSDISAPPKMNGREITCHLVCSSIYIRLHAQFNMPLLKKNMVHKYLRFLAPFHFTTWFCSPTVEINYPIFIPKHTLAFVNNMKSFTSLLPALALIPAAQAWFNNQTSTWTTTTITTDSKYKYVFDI